MIWPHSAGYYRYRYREGEVCLRTGAWLVVSGTTYANDAISGVIASTTSDDGYRVTLTYKVGSEDRRYRDLCRLL